MHAIVVVGTASNAGKSLLCAGLCRVLARKGYRVTPFKGQNMALNSYVAPAIAGGMGEMGYAQAVQAWAARTAPLVEMNPVLLKPQGDATSQVILRGQVAGTTEAAAYYRDYFACGWQAIVESLNALSRQFDVVICEGAGSPAEINLKHRDLTNMRIAKHLNAPTILVANIDLGGVFAHIIGTLALLDPDERALIRGIVINKFRGQLSLLQSGIDWLERETGIPVLGVLPHLALDFPAEDSVSLLDRPRRKGAEDVEIAVVRLPRLANFTDFDPLLAERTVTLRYVLPHEELGQPDAVILPGTKATIADLQVLHASGMTERLHRYAAGGGTLLGICGGLQMLGRELADPQGTEGQAGTYGGLGLLPIATCFGAEKLLRQRQIAPCYDWYDAAGEIPPHPICGYEIHQGRTTVAEDANLLPLFDDPDLGWRDRDRPIWGTYLHGLLENGTWRRAWLNTLRLKRGLDPLPTDIPHYAEPRDRLFDTVADAIETHLDLSRLPLQW